MPTTAHPTSHPTTARWRQLNLRCADWRAAERMAYTHLGPLLGEAQGRGHLEAWWFIRKGPVWRLRLRPVPCMTQHAAPGPDPEGGVIAGMVNDLRERGAIQGWTEGIYEPEIHAFGGHAGMATAHELFAADSQHILAHLAHTTPNSDDRGDHYGGDHRRELGLLLAARLLRAAGQEWHEQGDVWQRLAEHRAGPGHPRPSPALITAVRCLLTADTDTTASPLHTSPGWAAAFERAGAQLSELARAGELTRGLRAVLAHHLLFSFNRLGVSAEHQHLLATAASGVVFQEPPVPPPHPHPSVPGQLRADPDPVQDAEARSLRDGLADHIRGRGTFHTAAVENAFRTVARHLFLPGVELGEAYAPRPVVTKRAGDGTAVSSASSPNLVAGMLEALQVRPGHRVLEIGAATGINAALLAELTGADGRVVTIELDADLAEGARSALARAGYPDVEVICGDGALGHAEKAPYDRVVVTAGAWDIPPAWWRQLAAGGRLVVPQRLHGSGLTRVLALARQGDDRMVSTSALVCGFVPMRGADEHHETVVRLGEEVVLAVEDTEHPDREALANVLTHPGRWRWTGIEVRHDEPAEHLDLWLATSDRTAGFGRLSVTPRARAAGVVDPAPRWAGAALYTSGTLAYLAARAHDEATNELGVVAHGPDAEILTAQLAELLRRWARTRPGQPTITATPTAASTATATAVVQPGSNGVISREHTRLEVDW